MRDNSQIYVSRLLLLLTPKPTRKPPSPSRGGAEGSHLPLPGGGGTLQKGLEGCSPREKLGRPKALIYLLLKPWGWLSPGGKRWAQTATCKRACGSCDPPSHGQPHHLWADGSLSPFSPEAPDQSRPTALHCKMCGERMLALGWEVPMLSYVPWPAHLLLPAPPAWIVRDKRPH